MKSRVWVHSDSLTQFRADKYYRIMFYAKEQPRPATGEYVQCNVTLSPVGQDKKSFVPQDEPDYKTMYFEGDSTIKRIGVVVKEHIEQRFVKIAKHTPQKPGAEKEGQ